MTIEPFDGDGSPTAAEERWTPEQIGRGIEQPTKALVDVIEALRGNAPRPSDAALANALVAARAGHERTCETAQREYDKAIAERDEALRVTRKEKNKAERRVVQLSREVERLRERCSRTEALLTDVLHILPPELAWRVEARMPAINPDERTNPAEEAS